MARIPVVDEHFDFAAFHAKLRKSFLMVGSSIIFLTFLYYNYFPTPKLVFSSDGDRMAYVIQCNVLSVFFIMGLVMYIGNLRRTSHQVNPVNTKDFEKVEIPLKVLQNTMEQFIINIFLQLTAVTWVGDDKCLKLVPAFAFWFLLGRILFWIGFNDPAENRTRRRFGFMMTFMPSVTLAFYCFFKFMQGAINSFD